MQGYSIGANGAPSFNKQKAVIGVWHRPNSSGRENTLQGLISVLDEFASAGINTVFVEAFHHGMTFFRNEMVPYYRGYDEFNFGEYPDYLTAFVKEATARGISVHAWVQNFYIGVRDEVHFAVNHPDWILKNQHGSTRHTTEGQGFGGYIFLDPANSEARGYLIRFYDLMLQRFPEIKGLNLDYIRYPVSIFEENTDTGYTDVAMNGFAERFGIELMDFDTRVEFNRAIREKNLLEEWVAYRADFVTSFVLDVSRMMRMKHPGKPLSTAVFPELNEAYYKKKQNVQAWLKSGALDMVTPMVYSYNADDVREQVLVMKKMCAGVKCCAGLYATYHKQSPAELIDHINAGIASGSDGYILFDAAKTFFESFVDYKAILSEYNENVNND
ncbi:MAG: hypothetical protein E7676_00955 [Ruminococcaceae bacterium]|nr:hypothetical protein [Oscillospiraceae bacterium]